MFKDEELHPNVPAVNIHIFSLVQQLRLLLTLTFVPLSYLFGLCHDMYIQLGRVYLRDVWGLHWYFQFSLLLLLFQNLYQDIPLLLWQFSKSVWAPFHHKLAGHIFWEFIFNFDVHCVSCKFATYIFISANNKWLSVKHVLIVFG